MRPEPLTVAFDFNGDGVPDARVLSDAKGFVTARPSGLSPGSVTVQARYAERDATTGLDVVGTWSAVSFTLTDFPTPTLSQFNLKNDTGTPFDGVTNDPTLVGTIAFDDTLSGRQVEIDWTGDGTGDVAVFTAADGTFEFEPSDWNPGAVSVKARAVVWDGDAGAKVTSEWASLTFTLEAKTVRPPEITAFHLQNDTGSSNSDHVTTDATLTGTLTNPDGAASSVRVEFDYDGDGIAEGMTSADDEGAFTYLPVALRDGDHKVRVSGTVIDPYSGKTVRSDWTTLTFTLESATNQIALLTGYAIKNDTGTVGDGKTTDPTVVGTVVNPDGDSAYLAVEFDEDNDGESDGLAFANHLGQFEYRPYSLRPGDVTVKARAVEFDARQGQYVRGDWESLTFTLEFDPSSTGTGVPSADGAYATTVGAVTAFFNTATGSSTPASGGFDLGNARYVGAFGFDGGETAPNASPLAISSTWASLPVAGSASGPITVAPGSGYTLSTPGTFSHTVSITGTHFHIETNVSYSYTFDQKSTNGGESTSMTQGGTYKLMYTADGDFVPSSGGGYAITYMVYDLLEQSTTNSKYDYSNSYSITSGAVTSTGLATANATGSSSFERIEHGTYSNSLVTGDVKIKSSGSGSGTSLDTGTYVSIDPRSSGSGSYSDGNKFSNSYDYTEKNNTKYGSTNSVDGEVGLTLTNSASNDVEYKGTYVYDHDGLWSGGGYALTGHVALDVTNFQYDGTFTASASGFTNVGDYTLDGTYDQWGKYLDAGTHKTNQPSVQGKGSYLTDLATDGDVVFHESMGYDANQTSVEIDGDYAVTENGSTKLTSVFTNEYATTFGDAKTTGTLAITQISTDKLFQDSKGSFRSNSAVGEFVEGDLTVIRDDTLYIDHFSKGDYSRPNFKSDFRVSQIQDRKSHNSQIGIVDVAPGYNKAQGAFEVSSEFVVTSDWENGEDESYTRGGMFHHVVSRGGATQLATETKRDWGGYVGDLADVTWTGAYDYDTVIDTTKGWSTLTDDYSGNGYKGQVTVTWDGENGSSDIADGTYTKSATEMTADGTFDNKNYDKTIIAEVKDSGTYDVTESGGWRKGSYFSRDTSKADLSFSDSGTVTVRGTISTRATGDTPFVRLELTERDTEAWDKGTFDLKVSGVHSNGSRNTTSTTFGKSSNDDRGKYESTNGQVVWSKGTELDVQDAKSTTKSDLTYAYDATTSYGFYVGNYHTESETSSWVVTDLKNQYSRANSGIDITMGTGDDRAEAHVYTLTDETKTDTTVGYARPVVLTTHNVHEFTSDLDATDKYTFNSGGGYGVYYGVDFAGAGAYVVADNQRSGVKTRHEDVVVSRYDHAHQDAPGWDDDGGMYSEGSIRETKWSDSHTVDDHNDNYWESSFSTGREGSFYTLSDVTNKDEFEYHGIYRSPDPNTTGREEDTEFTTKTSTVVAEETNGFDSFVAPANQSPVTLRTATFDFSSDATSKSTTAYDRNFVTTRPHYHKEDYFHTEKTIAKSASLTDQGQYQYGSAGGYRNGAYTRTESTTKDNTESQYGRLTGDKTVQLLSWTAGYQPNPDGLFATRTFPGFAYPPLDVIDYSNEAKIASGTLTQTANARTKSTEWGKNSHVESVAYTSVSPGGPFYGVGAKYNGSGTYTDSESGLLDWKTDHHATMSFSSADGTASATYDLTGFGMASTVSPEHTGTITLDNGMRTSRRPRPDGDEAGRNPNRRLVVLKRVALRRPADRDR